MPLNGRKVNLFIVGAPKCGTTSLHYYLSQHPEVFMSPVKEPYFFSDIYSIHKSIYLPPKKNLRYNTKIIKDENTYISLFDKVDDESIIGEASPTYLWDAKTPQKLFQYNPDAKIIILLREPVERAYSHYLMELNGGIGIEKEKDFVKAVIDDFNENENVYGRSPLYIKLGQYYEQISRYYNVFPSNQIKIVLTKSFFGNVKETLEDIGRFLSINTRSFENLNLKKINESNMPKNSFIEKVFKLYGRMFFSKYINNSIDIDTKFFINNLFFSPQKETYFLTDNQRLELHKFFEKSNEQLRTNFNIEF